MYFVRIQRQSLNHGQAALTVVIFFLFISLTMMFGFAALAVENEIKVRGDVQAKESYFLAEAGIEDVGYRIIQNMAYDTSETISLVSGGPSATSNVSDVGLTEKSIVSTGDVSSAFRKVSLNLRPGAGTSLNYGAQSGYLGIVHQDTPVINGSIFSNGSVVRAAVSNRITINGDLHVASSTLDASQQNLADVLKTAQPTPSPGTLPPYTFNVRRFAGHQDMAQSFMVNRTGVIRKVEIYMRKVGTPSSFDLTLVEDVSNGVGSSKPDNNGALFDASFTHTAVSTNFDWVEFDIGRGQNPVYPGRKYWLILSTPSSTDTSNYYIVGGGGPATYTASSSAEMLFTADWSSGSAVWSPYNDTGDVSGSLPRPGDEAFKVFFGDVEFAGTDFYTGDIHSTINHVITTGDTVGYKIKGSIVGNDATDEAYYEVDGGSNTWGSTQKNPPSGTPTTVHPTPLPAPISLTKIDELITEVEASATCNNIPASFATQRANCIAGDDVDFNNANVTLTGPVVFPADLTIRGSTTFTMHDPGTGGNIYVKGDLDIGTAAACTIRLDSSFGASSGTIVAEGPVDVSICTFSGSGNSDSFMVIIGLSKNFTTPNAVAVHTNSLTGGVFYAAKGFLTIRDAPDPYALFGEGVFVEASSVINYQAGLANLDFRAGPVGGWELDNSWKEIE
ncbi:MAG: hypothetical protein A3C84_04430 [Candidatus Ryanbacteria bacterium RIFCSPHIGHO2_02_FULL_48_12]|uniref:Type 4 fimbrial biogenesis protein PilX N-terminal domain-containing protein n=1 Tax=Candidatus Ryanbacteria bacterium RIFCSPHIGHO2_01_FULL_48_27 TaxID=1802115 RepID=A0A1G2G6X4_9BACT|nr:MAG: hypothetical protein A2756_02370 [Candidatus Ryanbacteria bacterium RIFCSPHIGHO2_01_FULL_48_27]OGZ49826.1 MAG: hypothetical protein A3C84_04430 [Candidatus Ryanbacteria bacterium RIFCSPHIGHO2_02_FULL_48_12]